MIDAAVAVLVALTIIWVSLLCRWAWRVHDRRHL